MLNLFPEHLEQIREEAIAAYPHEAVWLITKKGCKQAKNIAADPENFFDISAADTARAVKAGLLAIVHSHTNAQHYPSEADMHGQVHTDVPWGIICSDGKDAGFIRWWGSKDPAQVEDLFNRGFAHGTADCYTLVRDYYLVKFGIVLKEFPREWMWWKTDKNTLEEGFPLAGFVEISQEEAIEGDVWLAYLSDNRLCHAGIYAGNGLAHHHAGSNRPVDDGQVAVLTPIFRYMPYIGKWLRHKDRL